MLPGGHSSQRAGPLVASSQESFGDKTFWIGRALLAGATYRAATVMTG